MALDVDWIAVYETAAIGVGKVVFYRLCGGVLLKLEHRLRLIDAAAIFSLTFICDVLLCLQPDFGSAIVLTVIVFHITYVAGLPMIVMAVGLGLGCVSLAFSVL